MSPSRKSVERGQSITFRVPSDTPDHLLKQLSQLKENERRNFSSKIAQFVLEGVNESMTKEKETVTIPLPKALTKEQRNWIKHEHSEALIGSILYQLLMDPVRATTLLASLNSNAYDINDALYLQEDAAATKEEEQDQDQDQVEKKSFMPETPLELEDDSDLEDMSLDLLQEDLHEQGEAQVEEEDDDDLLGDFLSRMNK
ncbi:hypothetical protein SAMN04487936_11720 [Halobacillus dabanensis]|uniref:Uncharacterized protein n=1 Tax=Halobacillus dabanensis TaxID=240302 RepID=A0A1I4ADX8_HALDA|nr:hypothetical protein [Halobacillus dabanensis]SFK54277.1 hypothetical protein SAMN04487936_11720 [Halobacillus dabanensis]